MARGGTRFTASHVATLPARPSPYTDPAQLGLQVLVREKRGGAITRSWVLRYKFKGQEKRFVIGHHPDTSLDWARGEARRLRELATQGIDPARARPKRRQGRATPAPSSAATASGAKHSIEFLVSEFVERYLRPTRKRPEYAEAILAKDVLPEWKGRDARTIVPAEVIELLDKIVDRGSPVAANRTAALLSQLFKFAIHRRIIVAATPVQLLYRPGGNEKARERVLSDEELQAFLADPKKCTRFDRLAHVMLVLLLTGQRRGELAAAKWSDMDMKAGTWTIPDENAKGGRGHVVPLVDRAVEELRPLKIAAKRSKWVLPANGTGEHHIDPKQLTRSLAKCQKRFKEAGIAAFTLHDLRRTMRTGLGRLKVPPHVAELCLGHAQPGVVGVYDRGAYLEEKRAALEKWETHLKALQP